MQLTSQSRIQALFRRSGPPPPSPQSLVFSFKPTPYSFANLAVVYSQARIFRTLLINTFDELLRCSTKRRCRPLLAPAATDKRA